MDQDVSIIIRVWHAAGPTAGILVAALTAHSCSKEDQTWRRSMTEELEAKQPEVLGIVSLVCLVNAVQIGNRPIQDVALVQTCVSLKINT